MKISTIGSGRIGGTLGRKWAGAGHEVFFSSRNPQSAEMQALLAQAGPNARAGLPQDAFAFGDVILLAMSGTALESVLKEAGDLKGKILIDATNRFDGVSNSQAAMRLQPGAKVVKAFNSVGFEVLENPMFGDEPASMMMAGDDADAKKTVAQLITDVGLEPVDLGDASVISALEGAVGAIWMPLSRQYGRGVALRVLKR